MFDSAFFPAPFRVCKDVFHPAESNGILLPLMQSRKDLFEGKDVFEIGSGSGIIGVYAGVLGARKVVATDIQTAAVDCTRDNAKRFGVLERMDARLVTPEAPKAYDVIKKDEQFDVIISNPPYIFDMDMKAHTATLTSGELGISIIDGLHKHLKKDGVAILLYRSLFSHLFTVEYAKQQGFQVTNIYPNVITRSEAAEIYTHYLDSFTHFHKLKPLTIDSGVFLQNAFPIAMVNDNIRSDNGFITPENAGTFPGVIIIRHRQ